jgi:hypothetical protein
VIFCGDLNDEPLAATTTRKMTSTPRLEQKAVPRSGGLSANPATNHLATEAN